MILFIYYLGIWVIIFPLFLYFILVDQLTPLFILRLEIICPSIFGSAIPSLP